MINRSLPYYLEDRTGLFSGSEFDDIYDRLFLRVASPPSHLSSLVSPSHPSHQLPLSPFSLMVYAATRRSSPHKDHLSYADRTMGIRPGEPAVVLQFGPRGALGSVTFLEPVSTGREKGPNFIAKETIHMGQWLQKTSWFGGSQLRKFRVSDGQELRWVHQSVEGQEWSLLDAADHVVAHYSLKSPSKPAFTTSGNTLVIHESHSHLAIEILASLTVMRHIAAHNL